MLSGSKSCLLADDWIGRGTPVPHRELGQRLLIPAKSHSKPMQTLWVWGKGAHPYKFFPAFELKSSPGRDTWYLLRASIMASLAMFDSKCCRQAV
jgi:hypothetical protein